ncbi:MAG: potassium channel family protein [Alphaproteobacteria bacterium]
MTLKTKIEYFYESDAARAKHFRYALLAFDVLIVFYLFISSFYYGAPLIEMLDLVIGVVVVLDVSARLWIAKSKTAFFVSPYGIADILTIISLLAPLVGENMAFLRVARLLRLLRSYTVLKHLRQDFTFFRRHEDVMLSATNLLIFIFVMTAVVFESQVGSNPNIKNYIDALYFTVTTLTTTGFGDITLQGDSGKLIAVIIMIFGVSLFIRLIQTVFRPNKVRHKCPDCGLLLHDRDAVHCKHCARVLDIADEGVY